MTDAANDGLNWAHASHSPWGDAGHTGAGYGLAAGGLPHGASASPFVDADLQASSAPLAFLASKSCKISKIGKLSCKLLRNFAIFWQARSRLYQNEILQENMRLTAFFKLYKICTLLHRCNLKILAKTHFEKSAVFVKIQ